MLSWYSCDNVAHEKPCRVLYKRLQTTLHMKNDVQYCFIFFWQNSPWKTLSNAFFMYLGQHYALKLQKSLRKIKSCSMLPQYSSDNIEELKTQYNPVREALDNVTHKKNPVQCCLNTPATQLHRKNPMKFCARGSRQHYTQMNSGQHIVNNIWLMSSEFYFGPVNFFIIPNCCKCRANIVQFSSKLHK